MDRIDDTPSQARTAAIAGRIDRPIVLVGLMGAGKSTVGRRLATLLRSDFIDADDAVEEAAQLSISEIFSAYGEEHFRDGERRVIARLMEERHGVIATGGGAFINEQTRQLILSNGIAVWIDCDIATLVERTSRRNTRPLLKDGDPEEILTRLYREREPFYSQAPIRVRSEQGPHLDTANRILEAIDQWL
ncbi:shikimate kinase [Parerythrobacter jejuensis]|uniref:Shikimate kinase n=1 Tax=Parerythrobacter jejuensis TaxID=795812 RepID=A0A845ATI0_9SPHN|nr:shikimate kinase [Parerythrobacter jejuensis]MXP32141.1 shikimate kinase [Parerythrobacter jejuensis]